MVSSSAIYPENGKQPFVEEEPKAINKYWQKYGTDKIEAEEVLLEKVPDAYIVRPPYLYGPMNNIYREAFVFDCALENRPFYLPKDGSMKLQFFHIRDLCKLFEIFINDKPKNHIYNVGNKETISIKDWVELCYSIVGKKPDYVYVTNDMNQRMYFCFHDYEYFLSVDKQSELLSETISMEDGLRESYEWYLKHGDEVRKTGYMKNIDELLAEN